MLDEFLTIGESLSDLSSHVSYHPKLIGIPKGGKPIQVCFKPDGSVASVGEDGGYRYYFESNHRQALAFKYKTEENPEKNFRSTVKFTEEFLKDYQDIAVFKRLSSVLPKINIPAAMQVIDKYIADDQAASKKKIKDYYILLNVVGDSVHTEQVFREFNDKLKSRAPTSEGLDYFGNSDAGFESFEFKSNDLRFYSLNKANQSFLRYGQRGCKIGDITKEKILAIAERLFGTQEKLTQRVGKLIVITTMTPNSEVIQNAGNLSWGEWKASCAQVINNLTGTQSEMDYNPSLVVVEDLQGAAHLRYFKTIGADKIAASVENFGLGLDNHLRFRKFSLKPLGVHQIHNVLNSKWKQNGERLKKAKNVISIENCYELFFGNKELNQMALTVFANSQIPMIYQAYQRGETDKYVLHHCGMALSLSSLLLHNSGILKETFMQRWSFLLGYLFQQADAIHKRYHESRGHDAPPKLLGGESIKVAHRNPVQALANFDISFQHFLNWASQEKNSDDDTRKYNGGWNYAKYKDIRNQLHKACENLPCQATSDDIVLMTYGFMFNDYVEKEQTNEQSVEA